MWALLPHTVWICIEKVTAFAEAKGRGRGMVNLLNQHRTM